MAKKFGTSMFGFKRKRVIDYIESVNTEHTDKIEELNKKLQLAQAALDAANKENSSLRDNVTQCEAQLQQLVALSQELRARVEADELIRQQIGDVFIEAKQSATTIIENATESAHSIVRSANECAVSTLDDIAHTRSQLDTVREDLDKMLKEFDKTLESISTSLDKAKSSIKPSGFSVNTDITEDDLIGNSIISNT